MVKFLLSRWVFNHLVIFSDSGEYSVFIRSDYRYNVTCIQFGNTLVLISKQKIKDDITLATKQKIYALNFHRHFLFSLATILLLTACNPAWQVASHRGNLAYIKSEFGKGISPNIKNDMGLTPLHHLTFNNSTNKVDSLNYLLSIGADPTIQTRAGWSPFGWSVIKKMNWASEAMFTHKSVRNDEGVPNGTPLIEAIFAKNYLLADRMIDLPGNLNAVTAKGDSALTWAIVNGQSALVIKLLEAGANPNCCTRTGNLLAFAGASLNFNAIKILLEKGYDTRSMRKWKSSAIVESTIRGNINIVKLLINNGVDVNERTALGDTALMWASAKGHYKIARLLVTNGANTFERNNGQTAATLAMTSNNIALAEYLKPGISKTWTPPRKPIANNPSQGSSFLAWGNILLSAFNGYIQHRNEYRTNNRLSAPYSTMNSPAVRCGVKPIPKSDHRVGQCVNGIWEQIKLNASMPCGVKPIPKTGHVVGRCTNGIWEQINFNSPTLSCGVKPIPKFNHEIGLCINGKWQQINFRAPIASCGVKPIPQAGFKIGHCVNGAWEHVKITYY